MKSPASRYFAALAAVAFTWAIRSAVDPILRELQPFSFFLAPVLVVGWRVGPGPAILAAILGWLAGDWFFCFPRHVILLSTAQEITASLVYLALSVGVIAVTHNLRRSRAQAETTLNSITDAFFAISRDWRFASSNPQAERLVRKPAAQLLGANIWDLFPGAQVFRQRFQQALDTGQPVHFEEFYAPLRTWFDVHAYPSPAGLSVYFRDISERKQAEDDLRHSEERFRALFTAMDEGFCIFEVLFDQNQKPVDYRYLQANPAFTRFTKGTAVVGRTARECVPNLEDYWFDLFGRVALTGEPARFEHESQALQTWYEGFAFCVGPPERHHVAILFNDITRRKEAEETLRRSEALYRTMAQSIPDGAMSVVNQDLRYVTAEGDLLACLSLSRQLLEGHTVQEVFEGEIGQTRAEHFRRALAGETTSYETDYRGRTIWSQFVPLRDERGETWAAMSLALDITKRKQAEQVLQRRTEHLQILHQAAADLLLGREPVDLLKNLQPKIADAFGVEVFMLYQAADANGHLHLHACGGVSDQEKEKLETLRYGRAICAKPAEALQPIIATRIQTREAPNRRFVRKLGFRSYLYYPLILNNRLHGTLAFASRQRDDYDRTDLDFFHTIAGTLAAAIERDRLETELQHHTSHLEELVQERTSSLQEMITELEHFSYTITHDMRAPLRAMRGLGGLLLEECGPSLREGHREYLQRIADSAERMDKLITDALQYSTVLRGELPLHPVDSAALLKGILESYPQFQPPHADVRIAGSLPVVLANEAGLTQCFSNLLGNAVKFVHPGQTPEVRVWAEEVGRDETVGPVPSPGGLTAEGAEGEATESIQEDQSESLSTWHISKVSSRAVRLRSEPSTPAARIWFEDRGIGIEREYHDKIWVMFQRLNKSYGGTGIGLALVRKAVERMGGRVGVESEPGQGSRFWVELRLAQQRPESNMANQAQARRNE